MFLTSMGAVPEQEDLEDVFPLPQQPEDWHVISDEQMLELILRTQEEQEKARQEAAKKKQQQQRRKLHGAPRKRTSMPEEAEFARGQIKEIHKPKVKEDFTFDALFKDLSPRLAKLCEDPDKAKEPVDRDPTATAAAAMAAARKARPAVALEEATKAVNA